MSTELPEVQSQNFTNLSHSKRSHRVAVSSFFFILGFCFASWASRIPVIQQKLGLNETQLGMVLFALPIGLFISLPVSGWLVSRKGSKKVVCIASLCYACILVTLGFAEKTFQLVVALFAFGFAGNMGNISMNTQAVGWNIYTKEILWLLFTVYGAWRVFRALQLAL